MNNFLDNFLLFLPNLIVGILILIIGFVVALLVKKLVVKLLSKSRVKNKLSTKSTNPVEVDKMTNLIGNLVFLLVFFLFLPVVFEKLAITGLATPFANFSGSIIAFLPKLIAAAVILYIGFFVAKIIRDVVAVLLVKVGLDRLVNKYLGGQKVKISDVLANVAYAFVIVPLIIIALDLVGLHAISEPAKNIIASFLNYVPKIFVALLLVAVGVFLAKLLANLLENLLLGLNVDGLLARVGITQSFKLSTIISKVVMVVLIVVFVVEALTVLELQVLQTIGQAIIAYLPLVLSSVLILIGAYLLASFVEKKIVENNSDHRFLAVAVKFVILGLAAFMILSQLGFAKNIVEYAFIIVVGAVAVAFALAFGLGGRNFASKKLDELDRKIEEKK